MLKLNVFEPKPSKTMSLAIQSAGFEPVSMKNDEFGETMKDGKIWLVHPKTAPCNPAAHGRGTEAVALK